jgi:hypothetical protein
VSAGLRKGWGTMVHAAVDRGAGRCESFSGPCDEELLLYLIERYRFANKVFSFQFLRRNRPNYSPRVQLCIQYPFMQFDTGHILFVVLTL